MPDVNALMTILQAHLRWHRARLFTLCALITALLRLRTVNLATRASAPLFDNRCGIFWA